MWSNLNLEPGPSGPQPNAGYTRQSQILAKLLNPLTPDLLQITMLILCNLLSKCCYTKHISNLTVMEIKAHFYIVIFIKWFRLVNTPCRPRADTLVSPVLSIIAQQYFHYHCIVWVPWVSCGSPCQVFQLKIRCTMTLFVLILHRPKSLTFYGRPVILTNDSSAGSGVLSWNSTVMYVCKVIV